MAANFPERTISLPRWDDMVGKEPGERACEHTVTNTNLDSLPGRDDMRPASKTRGGSIFPEETACTHFLPADRPQLRRQYRPAEEVLAKAYCLCG